MFIYVIVCKQHLKNMVTTKNPTGRSSSCLRKYRLLFTFGVTVLCVQIYLAHTFFGLDNGRDKSSRLSSGETGSSQPEEGEGLPKGLRQLKLPPDKQININKQTLQSQRNRTARIKLDRFTGMPTSLGCFKDDKTLRILSGYYHIFKGNNSPEHCAYMCLQSGYPYSGTEYSVECFCGMEEPSFTKRLPDSSCNMKCSGNPKQSCGGYLTINIYWTGIQKFKPQEAKNSSLKNESEQPARIAYLLTVNGRASRQVKRLINILYHPSHLFYIHVDARQDYLYREILEVEKSCKLNNIKVARGEGLRHASIWGGASLLTTLLKSAQQMLAHHHHWDFLVNLSESDFPVKSNNQLIEFLSWNKGMNFVKSHGREVQRFITKQGLDKTFVECEARMWRVGDRKLPDGIQVDGGSDWIALSRDFVEYVANPNPDLLVASLLKLFKYTLLPAESFFHTVLRNSRFCSTYIDNNLHVTNWKRKLGCKCQYKAVVDWCGCSPNDFKLEDFNRIRNTADRNLFFARKFEPIIDQRIVNKVEEWLYPDRTNRTIKAGGYDMYWQSLYHHADLSPHPDDALLTLSYSLARLVFQKLKMNYKDIYLLENTAYFREDRFTGILILAENNDKSFSTSVLSSDHVKRVEALVHTRHNFSTNRYWLGKIRSLAVSTDYDQKEQTFRNLVGSIGPYSNPVLAYEFDTGITVPQNISVLWIDPQGRLADINHILLEEMTLVGHVKPQLNDQLTIGTWQLLLVTDTLLVTKLNFLVTPLSYWKTKKIDPKKAKEIINGPNIVYHVTEEMNKKWSSLVRYAMLNKQSVHDQNRIIDAGNGIDDYIDKLVYEHYDIVEICDADDESRTKTKLQKCTKIHWSSLSPDSKAETRNLCQNY
ncbi:xylosyltransferase oxt isoform X3 [Harpegnathos saltator]|uniref:xylosyltransferase oxt isoform X3 n=1 Tax=Harpegnathos saltator TaxID=610380 RepID=UPI000DBEDA52|nr:xylosyltransferase oxt isoform X3 [Harpegnathos saltator]